MALKNLSNLLLLPLISFSLNAFAQNTTERFEGDTFISFIGKAIESPEMKDLVANYKLEMANNLHYLSKEGVELVLKKEKLDEIHFYQTSIVYGGYKGKLPNKLKFGMTAAELTQTLGKPTLTYNSGYYEYQFPTYLLSCWFEEGVLNQVVIASKES